MSKLIIKRATYQEETEMVSCFALHLKEANNSILKDDLELAQYMADTVFLPAVERKDPIIVAQWGHENNIGVLFWVIPEDQEAYAQPSAFCYGAYVLPNYRRKGVVSAMRNLGISILQERGIKYLYGNVEHDNKAALESMNKLGYELINYTMRLDVSPT